MNERRKEGKKEEEVTAFSTVIMRIADDRKAEQGKYT